MITNKVKILKDNVDKIIFDARYLNITSVTVKSKDKIITSKFTIVPFYYITKETNEQLIITLGNPASKNEILDVQIKYSTLPKATAISWVPKSQTFGKEHPFMFTQCQIHHCRSLAPMQDTPAVKSTFYAILTVYKPLKAIASGLLVGNNLQSEDGTYKYEQKIPVPSYLFAIVAGDIEYADMSSDETFKLGLYSEPKMLEKAKEELSELKDFFAKVILNKSFRPEKI